MTTRVQTIEQTSKTWKIVTFAAWGLLLSGILETCNASRNGDDAFYYSIAGVGLMALSVVTWIVARVGRYWHNG